MAAKKKSAAPQMLAAMMGSPAAYKPPTEKERVVNHARDAKVRATQGWIDGDVDTPQHEKIHARANHVIANKGSTKGFRGKTGERKKAREQGMPW